MRVGCARAEASLQCPRRESVACVLGPARNPPKSRLASDHRGHRVGREELAAVPRHPVHVLEAGAAEAGDGQHRVPVIGGCVRSSTRTSSRIRAWTRAIRSWRTFNVASACASSGHGPLTPPLPPQRAAAGASRAGDVKCLGPRQPRGREADRTIGSVQGVTAVRTIG